jgi:hypothetical protein
MRKHDRVVIELALEILWQASENSPAAKQDTVSVRLALRALLPHCPQQSALSDFWRGAGQERDGYRAAELTRCFNGVVLELEKSGAWKRRLGEHY